MLIGSKKCILITKHGLIVNRIVQTTFRLIEIEMEIQMTTPGDIKYYNYIAWVLFACFAINSFALIALNVTFIEILLANIFGATKAFILQLYFWGALGATIACSMFLADDKEINELESVKNKSDPEVLRYPDFVDLLIC